MAKRKTVELGQMDEDYLKSVMAGDIPPAILQNNPPGEEKEISAENAENEFSEPVPSVKELPKKPLVKRKKESKDYESLFLVKRIGSEKRQTYISKDIYNKISRFLPVITGEISITAYLDNILTHHLEEYQDEINELYDKNYKKPL